MRLIDCLLYFVNCFSNTFLQGFSNTFLTDVQKTCKVAGFLPISVVELYRYMGIQKTVSYSK